MGFDVRHTNLSAGTRTIINESNNFIINRRKIRTSGINVSDTPQSIETQSSISCLLCQCRNIHVSNRTRCCLWKMCKSVPSTALIISDGDESSTRSTWSWRQERWRSSSRKISWPTIDVKYTY